MNRVTPQPYAEDRILVETAIRIGQVLCRSAYWSGDHCNWIGRDSTHDKSAQHGESVSAVGADMYSGSAGISVFLADLYKVSGEREFRRVAIGALSRSLEFATVQELRLPLLSLFGGRLGLQYASSRVATAIQDDQWRASESEIGATVRTGLAAPHILDWMGGTAGAIGATLHLDRHYGTHELSALAVACGDELCRKAAWDGERCSWACKEANGTDFQGIPLAGLSHGSAGFALALLELFRVTGEDRFLAAANGALAYENGMFDTDRGWVDARSPFTRRIPGGIDGTFMTAWCHGAGGIALVRLRAAAIDCSRSDAHAGWARLALEFVKSAVDAALDAERFDASLCHGVLGLSEVFYTAGQLTGNEEYKQIGRATAARLVGRIRKTQDWPSGVSDVTHPSLMLGLSGIGHHLLRVAGCPVEPILVLL